MPSGVKVLLSLRSVSRRLAVNTPTISVNTPAILVNTPGISVDTSFDKIRYIHPIRGLDSLYSEVFAHLPRLGLPYTPSFTHLPTRPYFTHLQGPALHTYKALPYTHLRDP